MRWILVLLVAGVIAWLMLRQNPQPAATVAAAPAPTPVAALAPAPRPMAAAPVRPAATPAVNRLAQLRRVAQATGVELCGFRPAGNGGVIALAWSSSNAAQGGDFLEQAVRQGVIRDFDVAGRNGAAIENGRQVWLAEYRVHF